MNPIITRWDIELERNKSGLSYNNEAKKDRQPSIDEIRGTQNPDDNALSFIFRIESLRFPQLQSSM